MEPRIFLDLLHVAERLKDTTRHCTTSKGRPESVAEHSWRVSLMAMLLRSEFPALDMDKVVSMCLIHDLGECFTGDIPSFQKTEADSQREDSLLRQWVNTLPESLRDRLTALYDEMDALETPEAKLYKALDKLEAVIQHNESPLETWTERERELNQTYGNDAVRFSPWLTALRREMLWDTMEKLADPNPEEPPRLFVLDGARFRAVPGTSGAGIRQESETVSPPDLSGKENDT